MARICSATEPVDSPLLYLRFQQGDIVDNTVAVTCQEYWVTPVLKPVCGFAASAVELDKSPMQAVGCLGFAESDYARPAKGVWHVSQFVGGRTKLFASRAVLIRDSGTDLDPNISTELHALLTDCMQEFSSKKYSSLRRSLLPGKSHTNRPWVMEDELPEEMFQVNNQDLRLDSPHCVRPSTSVSALHYAC
jgi:hypothetical protein